MDGRYSIAAVSRITGLSIDTLRAWERRYGLVKPIRDSAGVRHYSDSDVRRLELAQSATAMGHAIRRIADLSDEQIAAIIEPPNAPGGAQPADTPGLMVEKIVAAVMRYDVAEGERLLNLAALLLQPEEFVVFVLSPLMHLVGTMWESGRFSIAQEHLVSNLVRNLVGTLVRLRPGPTAAAIVFATPPGEAHEFGIALAACLAALRGFRVCALGPLVPVDEVLRAVRHLGATTAVIGTTLDTPDLDQYVAKLRKRLSRRTQLWVGGDGAARKAADAWPSTVQRLATLDAFTKLLAAEIP